MRRAPSLHVHGAVAGVRDVEILKVLTRAEAETGAWPLACVLLWHEDADDRYAGSICLSGPMAGRIAIHDLKDAAVTQPGDIVRVSEGKSLVSVLYRRGSLANGLFVTERCNSLCVMCSQPPREDDDSWRVDELHRTIALVDPDEAQLGFTGGEPTLLGDALGGLLSACRDRLPNTQLHVLTNGRAFANAQLARTLIDAGEGHTVWAIPLYGDVASVHDEIVVADGAFEETLEGLFQLARFKARVEIRIVLHAMSLPRLPQIGLVHLSPPPIRRARRVHGPRAHGFREDQSRPSLDRSRRLCPIAIRCGASPSRPRDGGVDLQPSPLRIAARALVVRPAIHFGLEEHP